MKSENPNQSKLDDKIFKAVEGIISIAKTLGNGIRPRPKTIRSFLQGSIKSPFIDTFSRFPDIIDSYPDISLSLIEERLVILEQEGYLKMIDGDYLTTGKKQPFDNAQIIKEREVSNANLKIKNNIKLENCGDLDRLTDEIIDSEDDNVENEFESRQSCYLTGWKKEIMDIINKIPSNVFYLSDITLHKRALRKLFPHNTTVDSSIRSTLQKLRDLGYLVFLEPGKYLKK